jgi:DNA-binding XRE family transcriptional regulator
MTLVADKNANPTLTPAKKDVLNRILLNRILKMPPSQHQRICRLVDLYRNAKTEQDASEIGEVLAEILFGEPKDYTASKLSSDVSPDGREALKKHRKCVGKQLRKCRQGLKMSQEELAEKAGIPQSHVCRLETGKHAPTYLTIEKLANALGVAASQLDPGFND